MNWNFSKETEFQDKLTKLICFACKLISSLVQDRSLQARLDSSSFAMLRARQVFRMLKSFVEIRRMKFILSDPRHTRYERLVLVFSRSFYLIYWALDNLALLAEIRVIKLPKVFFARPAASMWYFGLVLNLLYLTRVLFHSYEEEAMIKETLSGTASQKVAVERLDQLTFKRYWLLTHYLRSIGDMISASNAALIPYNFLGKQLSKKWVGLGGVLSASSTLVQLCFDLETFK
mmetsp:Transcript_15650/g.28483  ORF Transcript_15650/g.28483 Transcript_15650/m.28483 type:complete len:232 (-) Transcript_15650:2013-2708(-)